MKHRIPNQIATFAPQIWLLLLLGLALCRLYLTADREVSALNSPHDEFWYVHKAFTGMWAGQYSEMSFMHPPIYVWWLQLLKTFGVSLRLGIDVAWVASVVYLAISVRNFTGLRITSLILAVFLLFHPYTIFIFDRALAETLLAVTIAVSTAAGLQIWTLRGTGQTGRRLVTVLLFSLMFAISFHIRKEGIALLVPLGVLAGLSFFWRETWWTRSGKSGSSPGALLFLSPLVATLCLGLAISTANYFKWGTFARYDLANPGYERAMAALSRIDTGRTPLQVSITQEMLAKAYSASPTFRALKPQMDGLVGKMWTNISSPFVTTKGEIGNGWFYWALRDAAAHAGWHSTAPFADQKYDAVSKELQLAFTNGVLKKRASLLPAFIDPDFEKWLPSVPASLWNVLRVAVFPRAVDVGVPKDNATPAQFREYSRITGRRSLPPTISLSGWVIAPPGTLVGFAAANAEPDWMPISAHSRPDVPGAFAIQVTSRALTAPDLIVFSTPDKKIGYVLLSALQSGRTAMTSGTFVSALGIDVLDRGEISHVANSKLGVLTLAGQTLGIAFAACLLLSMLFGAIIRRASAQLIAAMICLLFCASRLGLFAILDASSWNGAQARYMLPILPLFGCAGALGITVLLRQVRCALVGKITAMSVFETGSEPREA